MNTRLKDDQPVRGLAIQLLFEIIEQSSEGTVSVDKDANIIWMNEHYLSLQQERASTRSRLRSRQSQYNFAHFIGTRRPACRSNVAQDAVLLTAPSAGVPAFTGVFMEKMGGFIKLYFSVLLLGAVFGKRIGVSGCSRAIGAAAIGLLGTRQAMRVIVRACALLTDGGVLVFVVIGTFYATGIV